MFWKNMIIFLAIAGLLMCGTLAVRSTAKQPVLPPLKAPANNPYSKSLVGAGIVEAASENVVIGVNEAGRVKRVFVREGQHVNIGDPLLQTDTQSLEAQRVAALAAVNTAEAALKHTQAYQRAETGANLQAQVAQAKALKGEADQNVVESRLAVVQQEWQIKDQQDQISRLEIAVKAQAQAEVDLVHAKFVLEELRASLDLLKQKVLTAQAKVETAKAGVQITESNLQTYQAGPWEPDVDMARAAVAEARARVAQIDLQIERCTVRSPINAVVLRRQIHEGEYATASDPNADADAAPLVLGNMSDIHVRVDIDEFDAQRFQPGTAAIAVLKSGDNRPIQLEFIRVNPFVIPKRALTNSQTELVDTRVLQAIYKVSDSKTNLFIGQQVDVFISIDEQSRDSK